MRLKKQRGLEGVPGSATKPILSSIYRRLGHHRVLYADRDGDFVEASRPIGDDHPYSPTNYGHQKNLPENILWPLSPDGRPLPNSGVLAQDYVKDNGPLTAIHETDVLYRYLDFIDARLRDENI